MTIIITTAAALIILWGLFSYNKIIALKNQVSSAWSDIDVQLTRRHDLIPELVKTVKAYKDYEKETLELTTLIRSAEESHSPTQQQQLETKINNRLDKLILLQEAYPELKANSSFLQLMQALTDTEDKLQYARRYYNGSVKVYNTKLQQVPDNLIANLFRFKDAEFFELDTPEMAKAIKVDMND
ncbi:LemA family protein [Kangiella marina]|uniref:LemA family protein n=1 Tax=Kangiella marina TaxID=1079178 RepID=A0ABP8IPK0_9GAMM